jgi:poly-gamma-glutamate synthesis protein (capsule biosynthesis protein)
MNMKRKKPKYGRIISFFLLLLIVIGLGIYVLFFKDNISNDKDNNPIINDEEDEKPKESSLSMLMVGDGLIHANVFNDAKAGDTYDFSPMFDDVRDIVKEYDLAFYNQETPFAGKELKYSGYPNFNTPSEFGDEMLSMGFNLVSLATNHTMDKGSKGAINALGYWNSKKENVLAAGSYLSEEARKAPDIREENGIKYTMLAYTVSTNLAVPANQSYLLNRYDKEKARKDIESVRDKVDLLIVSMHWGTEYATKPNAQQKEIANYLASLGVDIIIGTHTHSVQPIEYIDDTLVVYSLGNFISSQLDNDKLTGLMVTLKVTKKEDAAKIDISNVQADLIYTYYKEKPSNPVHTGHTVIPYSKLTTVYFPDYVDYYDKYKDIITSLDDTIAVGAINE